MSLNPIHVGLGDRPTARFGTWPPAAAEPLAPARSAPPSSALAASLRDRARTLAFSDPNALRAILRQAYPDADRFDLQRLELRAAQGELPLPERVRFVDRDTLEGASAAYDALDGGEVLIAADLRDAPELLSRAYAEEAGHHLDRWLGGGDSTGDEGAIFARGLLERAPLAGPDLAAERADRDRGLLVLGERAVRVEFWDSDYAGGEHQGDNPNDDGDSPSEGGGVSGGSSGAAGGGSDGASGTGGGSDPGEDGIGDARDGIGLASGDADGNGADDYADAVADGYAGTRDDYESESRGVSDEDGTAASDTPSERGYGPDRGLNDGDDGDDGTIEAPAAPDVPDEVTAEALAAGRGGTVEEARGYLDAQRHGYTGSYDDYLSESRGYADADATETTRTPAERGYGPDLGLDQRSGWERARDWLEDALTPDVTEAGLSPNARARLLRDVIEPGLAGLPAEMRDAVLAGRLPGGWAEAADELAALGLSEQQIGEAFGRAMPAIAAGIEARLEPDFAVMAARAQGRIDEGLLDRIAGAVPATAAGLRAEIEALRALDPTAATALQSALSDVLDPATAALDRARLRADLQAWADRPLELGLRDMAELALGFTPAGTALDVRDLVQALDARDWLGVVVSGAALGSGVFGDLLGAVIGGTMRLGRHGLLAEKHILEGEINRRGQAVGFHFRPGGIDPATARIVGDLTAAPDRFGVYKARVEVWDPTTGQWVGKATDSSFFPDSMTRKQIADAIDEALGDAFVSNNYNPRSGFFTGKTVSGMQIDGYFSNGTTRSAYPVYEKDQK